VDYETRDDYNQIWDDIGLPHERAPETTSRVAVPADTIVVSADNHFSIIGDIFYERFPANLKDRAPRLWTDDTGFHHWYIDGKSVLPLAVQQVFSSYEKIPGCVDVAARMKDLDAEGTDKEIVFGNGINTILAHPDLVMRDAVFRVYNERMAELGEQAPGRFHGVAHANYWDGKNARSTLAEIKALGLKAIMLPIQPKSVDGASITYADPSLAPFWEAAEEIGLPICFHVMEQFYEGPGAIGITTMMNLGPFRKNLAELIFGGIFDRHPELQVVFVEADVNWVPGALQCAAMIVESFGELVQPKIRLHPHEYWRRNCYATFMHDPVGMRMLDIVGADRVMWSSDYPHPESSLGYSRSAMGAVASAVSAEEARMILGGTAMKVFDLA
jgi:predicted TIM-barrel fold metal-dependent hydrolase